MFQTDLITRLSALKVIETIKENKDAPKNYGTLLDISRIIRHDVEGLDINQFIQDLKISAQNHRKAAEVYLRDGYDSSANKEIGAAQGIEQVISALEDKISLLLVNEEIL